MFNIVPIAQEIYEIAKSTTAKGDDGFLMDCSKDIFKKKCLDITKIELIRMKPMFINFMQKNDIPID